jgi:phosphoenolpyruvate carboxykinase (ATP)
VPKADAVTQSLEYLGFRNTGRVHWNLGMPELVEMALRRGEGQIGEGGPLVVRTGIHTGRSVNDKFIVREPGSEKNIWWGNTNRPYERANFETVKRRMLAYAQQRELFVQDVWGGADPTHRLPVRIVTELAWHNLFARNLLINPPAADLANFKPDFTIIDLPGFSADPAIDGARTETVILLDFAERLVLIGGTSYAGEIKKSVFSVLNYLLPDSNVMPMHCSVNVGERGDAAIFFGLSGTGKTTLSADPHRTLIGDDEHGWSEKGLFNFEGGCYAKVIRLSPTAEPEIYATTRRFGTVLENVTFIGDSRRLNLDDDSLTENTRAAYPLDFIPNASETGICGHPENVIMLTADAFGVLPPISRLSPEQAMYHFLSGYTARVAGTEKGLGKEPQATFSTCFGAPFMPRHPSVYGNLLKDKIARHKVNCWLVNTGWTGGVYGVGHRMPIGHTRALLRAALDGSLSNVPMAQDENFGFAVPTACAGVPAEALKPRNTWADKAGYDAKAKELVGRFQQNFQQFEGYVDATVKAAAPKAA